MVFSLWRAAVGGLFERQPRLTRLGGNLLSTTACVRELSVTGISVVFAIGLAVGFAVGYAVRAAISLRHRQTAMRRRYLL